MDLNNDLDTAEQDLMDAQNERAAQRAKYEKKHTDTVNSVDGVRTAMNDIIAATSFAEKEAILKSAKVQALVALADPGDKSREHAGLGASSSITEVLETLLQDWEQKAKRLEDNEKAKKELYDRTSATLRQKITDTEAAIESSKIQLSETRRRSPR